MGACLNENNYNVRTEFYSWCKYHQKTVDMIAMQSQVRG